MSIRCLTSLTAVALAVLLTSTGVARAQGAAEKELLDAENRWAEATVKADVKALEALYADEYLAIDPMGATFAKGEDIANVKSGTFKLQDYKLEDVKVRLHGDVAVVTGKNTIKGSYMGKAIDGAYRFTDTFVKRGGRWQVLTTQGTMVAPK